MGKSNEFSVISHDQVLLMSHVKGDDLTERRAVARSKETAKEHDDGHLSAWQDLQAHSQSQDPHVEKTWKLSKVSSSPKLH